MALQGEQEKNTLLEQKLKIIDLEKQISSLLEIKNELETECKILRSKLSDDKNNDRNITNDRTINTETIENITDRLVNDDICNIKYIPDWVEKMIYKNTMILSMKLLEEILSKGNVTLMGHEITINVNPKN